MTDMTDIEHKCRLSLISAEETWSLGDRALSIKTGKTSVEIPYEGIRGMQLITFAGVGGRQGRLTVRSGPGAKRKTGSHHYASLGNFKDRSLTYVPFVRELARRVADANPKSDFRTGSGSLTIAWGLISLLLVGVVLLAILGAIESAAPTEALISVAGLVLVASPFAIRWMTRSKPARFDPRNIPDELLV